MNTRQLEADYKQQLDRIHKKVRLGEISQEEGEFLLLQIRERKRRKISRLKRPGRKIFLSLCCVALAIILFFFLKVLKEYQNHNADVFDFYVIAAAITALLVLFFFELKRVEKMSSKYFSRAFYGRIIKRPEIELEVQKVSLIQLQIALKNSGNLFSGLNDSQIWQLKSNILTTISSSFDLEGVFFEEMGSEIFVVSIPCTEDREIKNMMLHVLEVFNTFQEKSGEWYAKSVQVGASLVVGDFLCGNMGEHLEQHRSYGKGSEIGYALAQASGWFELLINETCLERIQSEIYYTNQEPIFSRSLGELIPVYSFQKWKEV